MRWLTKILNYIFKRKVPVEIVIHDLIDWEYFFECTKARRLIASSTTNKATIGSIYKGFMKSGDKDLKTLAYGLATCRIEVGPNMMPVREGFKETDAEAIAYVRKHNRKYGKTVNDQVYYGRGYMQLTWDYNYKKEGWLKDPDLALDPVLSASLLFKGLLDGRWNGRGKGLKYYLDSNDNVGARRTINIQNKAELVAEYYLNYLTCLRWKS